MANDKNGEYAKIPIEDFVSGATINVDVFIQLSDLKYVKVLNSGESFDIGRINKYAAKQVTHLYVRSKDYPEYLKRGLTIAGIIVGNEDLPFRTRSVTLTKVAANVFTEIDNFGMNSDSYGHSKVIAEAAMTLCQAHRGFREVMDQLVQIPGEQYGHGVAVSVIAVMIGAELGWKGVVLEKLALGGLLHDIGKKELSPDLLKKNRAFMTDAEVASYESHPTRGMHILRAIPDVPDDVIAIAYEHHENAFGQGFPRKVKLVFTNPLARVVSLADEFCRLTIKSLDTSVVRIPTDALIHIQKVMRQPFWPDAFKALENLINNGPSKRS